MVATDRKWRPAAVASDQSAALFGLAGQAGQQCLDKAKPGQQVRIAGPDEKVTMSNGIARADVARFMLAELDRPAHLQGKVVITTK